MFLKIQFAHNLSMFLNYQILNFKFQRELLKSCLKPFYVFQISLFGDRKFLQNFEEFINVKFEK